MTNKAKLQTVIESIINDDTPAAEKALHAYLRGKIQTVLGEDDGMSKKDMDMDDMDMDKKDMDDMDDADMDEEDMADKKKMKASK